MEIYIKPTAELIKFETEDVLLELQDIGDGPSVGGGVEDW